MQNLDLEKEINRIIADISYVSIDETDVNEKINLYDDLSFDSLQIMQLIVEIEEMFLIEIADEDLDIDRIIDVSSLYELVRRYMQ